MELNIGPYIVSRRTEYSKLRIVRNDGKKILGNSIILAEDIMKNYNKQTLFQDNVFNIKDNKLIAIDRSATDEDIKYLFVPEDITTIGRYVFNNKKTEYVCLPNTLTELEDYAFYRAEELIYIDIPNSVTKIGEGAFSECDFLQKVKLPNICKIDEDMFYGCVSLDNIEIPDTVTSIQAFAFYGCSRLKNIKLSNNLKQINIGAFSECTDLENIYLPESLEIIGREAFDGCTNLKEIIIPDSVSRIYESAFNDCENLEYVRLPKNIEKLPDGIFKNCVKLRNISIPNSVTSFGRHVFSGTDNLYNIDIPKNLIKSDGSPFARSNIKSLTFNYDLEDLEVSFSGILGNSDIDKIIIGNNVKKITEKAFKIGGCKIKEIEFHGSKNDFENFKKNNKKLFDVLSNIQNVSLVEKTFNGLTYKNEYVEDLEI